MAVISDKVLAILFIAGVCAMGGVMAGLGMVGLFMQYSNSPLFRDLSFIRLNVLFVLVGISPTLFVLLRCIIAAKKRKAEAN